MSSSHISEDNKTISFEINSGGVVGRFMVHHLDGDELNPNKILMRIDSNGGSGIGNLSSSMSVVILKDNTQILSHFFRHAADVMDEWYKKE